MSTSEGHLLAARQIAKHDKDRYPHAVLQFYKVMDELRELGEALEHSRCSYVVVPTAEVRAEYADVGLSLYALGNKLGIDLIECMTALVASDDRKFGDQ